MLFKSLLESFQMMKRSRPKVAASKNQLTEYELQRLQKLKVNAERMEALGSASLANKILEDKTKALFCPSAMLNSTPENEDDASTSEYDGENEVETDNLTSGKRKASKQVSKQVNKSSLRPKTMADVVEVNSRKKHAVDEVQNIHSLKVARVQDQCIQKKEQVISEKKGSKRAFCSPGSMSAYLEFRKKQKENNEAFVASNQSLNDSLTRNTRICGAAFYENDNDDADALSRWLDEADALNENDDDVGNEHEGDQELEDDLLSNYGREGTQGIVFLLLPSQLPLLLVQSLSFFSLSFFLLFFLSFFLLFFLSFFLLFYVFSIYMGIFFYFMPKIWLFGCPLKILNFFLTYYGFTVICVN
ncbi:uncharacterized protein LOC110723706 [Chenopodium quinoa]|uniref:uncharacterized protein LOC110723706 n=1 Tax=Chenopodium quinoa TaxID=63459 RepID=UPI000B76C699|nr:uncharacterized protein LOC110723706 [Chenopodium quinoa]